MRFQGRILQLCLLLIWTTSCSTATDSQKNKNSGRRYSLVDEDKFSDEEFLDEEANNSADGDLIEDFNEFEKDASDNTSDGSDLELTEKPIKKKSGSSEGALDDELLAEDAGESAEDLQAEQEISSNAEVASANSDDISQSATLTGLDFKSNANGGTILIRGTQPLKFSKKKSSNQQVVIEIPGVTVPKKFQRPYDTKEFKSPIVYFQAIQGNGDKPSRIVVQMKSQGDLSIQSDGSTLVAMASPHSSDQLQSVDDSSSAGGDLVSNDQISTDKINEADRQFLKTKTLDDFLSGNIKFTGRPISIEVKETDIRDIFSFIAEETGLNLVLAEDVVGKISLKLRQIPWDQALVVLMQTKQLGYVRQGNILRIAPLKTIRSETESTRELIEAQRKLKPLKVKIFPISYAQVTDLENQAKDFTSEGRGKVRADKRTNSLIVTDIDENIQKISELVRRLDTQTPQVLIEGRVVEARERIDKALGFSWSQTGSQGSIAVAMLPNSFNTDIRATYGDINARLQLLETEEKVKILSSPKIVTLNNEKASISQSTEIPYYSVTASTVAGVAPTVSVQYKKVTLELAVSPQITAEGGIILDVDIKREFAGAPDSVNPSSGARPINARNAKTKILVKNGETAVLGGIYQIDQSESESKVPLLSDLPIIGNLFKNKISQKDKNELMIFLTPRALNRSEAFESRENM